MDKKILCLDFDGVCHSYKSGWQGADVIPDPAVPGLFEFLELVKEHFDVHIFSSRTGQPGGRDAMLLWFMEERAKWRTYGGLAATPLDLYFPTEKPAAFVTLDDRALTFDGTWPDVEKLIAFKPWNKR